MRKKLLQNLKKSSANLKMNDDCAIKIAWESDGRHYTSDLWGNYCDYARQNLRSITLNELLRSTKPVDHNARFKQRVIEDLETQGAKLADGYLIFKDRELMTEFVLKYS